VRDTDLWPQPLALQPRTRFAKDKVVIDANTRLVVVTAVPCPATATTAAWKETHHKSHKQVRARVVHVFARCRPGRSSVTAALKGDGVHHAKHGIARLHNLALAG
jgi:hypothetical protein